MLKIILLSFKAFVTLCSPPRPRIPFYKTVLFSLFFAISSTLTAQQIVERPNVESTMRALQERYVYGLKAEEAMANQGGGQAIQYLEFPARKSDGMKPGPYPTDCFYDPDIFDSETQQMNMASVIELHDELRIKVGLINAQHWLHPSWRKTFISNPLIVENGTAQVPFVKDLADYYPGGIVITEANYVAVYNTINLMIEEMETLFFQVLIPTTGSRSTKSADFIPTLGASCATVMSTLKSDFDALTPTGYGGIPESLIASQSQSIVVSGIPPEAPTLFIRGGGMAGTEGNISIDYTPLTQLTGDFEIFGYLENFGNPNTIVTSLSSTLAPHTSFDNWFPLDSFAFTGGGTYNSPLYAAHSANNIVADCPPDVDVASSGFSWALHAWAVVKPDFEYVSSDALTACDECGNCAAAAGVCANLAAGSISYKLGLGKTEEGYAGDLNIYTQTISPLSASPFDLQLNIKGQSAQVIRDGAYDNILKQIVTDQSLIDIEVTDPYREFVVRYYEIADSGNQVDGFYEPDIADAFKTVTVTNPDPSQYAASATTDLPTSTTDLSSPTHGLPLDTGFYAFLDSTGPTLPVFTENGATNRTTRYHFNAPSADVINLMYWDSVNSVWAVDTLVSSDDTQTLTIVGSDPFDTLNIVDSTSTRTRSISYTSNTTDITADHVITLSDNQDGKIRNHESIRVNDTVDTSLFTVTKTETDASANVIRKTQTDYKVFPWNVPTSPARQDQAEILTQIEDPDGEAWTMTYNYYDDSLNDGDNYGKRKSIENPDGSWEVYEYDADGFLSKTIRPFKDSSLSFVDAGNHVTSVNRSTLSDLDGDTEVESIKTTVELIDGDEVSRSYLIVWSNVSSGLSLETSVQATTTGAAWDASGNLRTDRWTYFDGNFNGDIAKEKQPNGTITLFIYSIDAVTGEKTTTIRDGAPNVAEDDVIAGTETVTIVNAQGGQVSREVFDIATGFTMSSAATAANDFDGLGRPLTTLFLDGTTEVRTWQDCCGIDTVTDRTGLTTTTQTELDGTLESVGTNGIITRFIEGYDTDSGDGVVGFTRTTELDGRGASDTFSSAVETYSPSGRIIASLDPRDAVNRLTLYGQSLNVSSQWERTVTLPNNAVSTQVFHRDGQLFEERFEGELRQRFEYGVESDTHDGNIFFARTEKLIRLGENEETTEWTKTYRDMLGRVYKVEAPDPDGGASTHLALTFFNALGQRIRDVDPDGQQNLYAYNSESELEYTALDVDQDGVIDFAGTDRISRVQEVVTNSGRPKNVIRQLFSVYETLNSSTETIVQTTDLSLDGLDTWSTSYGIETHQSRVYNGSGTVTDITTRADGTTETVTAVNGFITTSITQHSTEGGLANISFTPDDFDRVQLQTDNLLSATWQYSYYETGQLFQNISPESSVGAGDAQSTTYAYDVLGQPLDVTLPDASVQSRRYHGDGQLAKTFGSQINPVEFTYDRQGRQRTLKTWQSFDTVSETGTSGSATTTWIYNPLGLLERKQYDDASTVAYTYSSSGRLETKTGGRGIVTTYAYDPNTLDQTGVSHDDGITASVSYGYDRQGRVVTVTDASGTRSIAYEDGLPLDETYTAGVFSGYQIDRRIDSLNRYDRVSLIEPGITIPYQNTYTYDGASRLQTASFNAHTVTHIYDPASELRQIQTFHNGTSNILTVNQRFDNLNRVKSRESLITGGDSRSYSYLYNSLNQRTRATAFDSSYWDYSYDALGQVDSAIRKDAADTVIPGYNYGYTFDDIGNRTQTSTNGRTASYTSNILNQYNNRAVPRALDILGIANAAAAVTVNTNAASRLGENFHHALDLSAGGNGAQQTNISVTATLPDGGDGNTPRVADAVENQFLKATPETFTHDADGNLTQDGQWIYTWDANNRLITMETQSVAYTAGAPRQKLEFAYDSQGRRFSKKVYDWDLSSFILTSESVYLYDGWNLIAELNAATSALKTSYFWGADLSGTFQGAGGVGGLLALTDSFNSTSYPAYDGNGNVMGYYTSDTGTSLADFEYGPFGEKIRENVNGSSQVRAFAFSWSTKYHDMETGLFYFGYRYYNAETGRWLNRDPIEENGGINLYGMVENDAVNQSDLLGLNPLSRFQEKSLNITECAQLKAVRDLHLRFSRDALSDYLEALNETLDTRDFYAWSSFAVSTIGSVYNGIRGTLKTAKDAIASDRRTLKMLGDRSNWQGPPRPNLRRGGGVVDGIEYAPGSTYDEALRQIRSAHLTGVTVEAGAVGLITGGANALLEFNAAESITELLDERIDAETNSLRLNYEEWQRKAKWLGDQYEGKCACLD
jgi:RHS repeat-associated protein